MFKAIRLEWTDATGIDEWMNVKDLPDHAHPCISIGFVVKQTRDYFYLANTVSKSESADEVMSSGVIMIPKKWVKNKTELDLEMPY
jgi:hypothetical protein